MKAISPMVATVLLVAFTIGVGALISIFATGLTTTSTGVASNQSEALSRCAGAWVKMESVTSTQVIYSNPNQVTLISLIVIGSDGRATTGASSLAPGASTSTATTPGTNTSITVRGLCQNTVTVEGRCTSYQPCWDI